MTLKLPSSRQRGRSPLSLRLTDDERRLLEVLAAQRRTSVSVYVRARLFGQESINATDNSGSVSTSPLTREQMLARILANLGGLQVLRNLSDLAEAARVGVLPLTPQVVEEIRSASYAVVAMRDMLVRALGLKPAKRRLP